MIRKNYILSLVLVMASISLGEQVRQRYFAHKVVKDQYGVIAPWYQGQNGVCDFRVRIAAETMKRFPWTRLQEIVEVPAYLVNGQWKITQQGDISVPPFNHHYPPQYGVFIDDPNEWQWANGDYGQRSYYVIMGLVEYYQYSGDPVAMAHIYMQVEHLLDYTLTPPEHTWPRFPISVPIKGRGYHYYDPTGYIQLDISAQQGLAVLKAYQLTGEKRWFEAAKQWADAFAANRDHNPPPGTAPWARYATPENGAPWDNFFPNQPAGWGTRMTGGVALVWDFLDEIIRLGYSGADNAVVKTRDQCQKYLKDCLLPDWTINDTWGRNYWDNPATYQSLIITDSAVKCFMAEPEYFSNWKTDTRNILGLFFNHMGVFEGSRADTYNGAWAYPESFGCCGLSLDYAPMEMAVAFAQYGVLADSEWARELARRQIVLTTYHFHETGVVEDNIDGGGIVAPDWFKIVHPMPLKHVLEIMGWLPEILGANRENHIMRSSRTVNDVRYGDGEVSYSTFDAPVNTVDVLRLAFKPESVTADDQPLKRQNNLKDNGYTIKSLPNGDCIVTIRHDGKRSIKIKGADPQQFYADDKLTYQGAWTVDTDAGDEGGAAHVASTDGAAVIFNFSGNQVRLLGRVSPKGGKGDVYVDGVKQLVGIDSWNPQTRYQQVLYYKNGLANGRHELKVTVQGKGNPHSNGNNVYIDGAYSSAASGTAGFGSGGGPTGIQRMIFGYPNRKPYLDSSGNPWYVGTEFIARTGIGADSVLDTWWTKPLDDKITGTCDPELFHYGIHWKEFWVNVTIGPGQYYVKLKFAACPKRISDIKSQAMNIMINGRLVAERVNIAATAKGKNKAVELVFNDIKPRNGIIEVKLMGNDGSEAFLHALEVGPGSVPPGAIPVSVSPNAEPLKTTSPEKEQDTHDGVFIPGGVDGDFN